MGLQSRVIPSSDISVSSQKNPSNGVDAVRMNNPTIWTAASNDRSPNVQIRFPQSKARLLYNLILTITCS